MNEKKNKKVKKKKMTSADRRAKRLRNSILREVQKEPKTLNEMHKIYFDKSYHQIMHALKLLVAEGKIQKETDKRKITYKAIIPNIIDNYKEFIDKC